MYRVGAQPVNSLLIYISCYWNRSQNCQCIYCTSNVNRRTTKLNIQIFYTLEQKPFKVCLACLEIVCFFCYSSVQDWWCILWFHWEGSGRSFEGVEQSWRHQHRDGVHSHILSLPQGRHLCSHCLRISTRSAGRQWPGGDKTRGLSHVCDPTAEFGCQVYQTTGNLSIAPSKHLFYMYSRICT